MKVENGTLSEVMQEDLKLLRDNPRKFWEGVTCIGKNAFYQLESLTSIKIPKNVISIELQAFCGCKNLHTVTFSMLSKLKTIGERAFCGCGISGISIPVSVKAIESCAFSSCDNLKKIFIPKNVASLGGSLVSFCDDLTSISVDPKNKQYYSENDCVIEKSNKKLISACNVSTIASDVTEIGDYAFNGCAKKDEIIIPDGVKKIGDFAFCGCRELSNLKIPNGVLSIGEYAFSGCCYALESIIIPDSVTKIGDYAFDECSKLKTITLPKNLKTLGAGAFYMCQKLTTLSIPDGVTRINESTFEKCEGLKSVRLPNDLEYITAAAFQGRGCHSRYGSELEKITYKGKSYECNRATIWHIDCLIKEPENFSKYVIDNKQTIDQNQENSKLEEDFDNKKDVEKNL